MNRRGAAGHRRELLAGLQGTVIEVGAGEGSSFAYYPDTVRSVLAVEPDDYLRALASEKARSAPVPVGVLSGMAEKIPAPDHSADAVVVSLVLCSVPNQEAALAEIRRVLRPEGTLAFYEHVRSRRRFTAAVEDLVSPAWQRLAGGCHPNRNTLDAIAEAGFKVVQNRRFSFAPAPLVPSFEHILGRAISPRKAS
ncbi:class I SAM-dependent methyltransferase [Arthrobacter terricola]|uniref:Class I SAM-dependent methyltransferase n=2 Tax=Arthrobacter TaxID=1663 RepID=A0A4R5KXX7_9MICC|nr:class I SAM-dependent methyltransferase [Arthrobacter terricola]MBT8160286.1 class I SAM-dependent methyltransferase [Arthrobacter sp. GN70]TDG00069.1 class I SAM-dependent methyltransferase [Arthrobacter terricola]